MKTPGKKMFNSLFLLSAVVISNHSYASGDEIKDPILHGEEAHNNHCYKCHSDDVYTRENRFVIYSGE